MRDLEGLYIACALALGLVLVMCSGCSWMVDFDRFHARRPSGRATDAEAELVDADAQKPGVFDGSVLELDASPEGGLAVVDASRPMDASMRMDAAADAMVLDAGPCGPMKREECKADPCASMKQVTSCVRSENGVCLEMKTMLVCVPGTKCTCVELP